MTGCDINNLVRVLLPRAGIDLRSREFGTSIPKVAAKKGEIKLLE